MTNGSEKRVQRGGLGLGLGVLAIAVAFLWRDRETLAPFAPEPAAALAASSTGAEAPGISAIGRLQPKDGVRTIAGPARTVAVVGQLFVDEGDRVHTGQLLVRLDDADVRAARIERAEVRLANAKAELARHEKLRADRVVSESLYDKLKLEHDVAIADLRLEQAEFERGEVRSPIDGQVLTVFARAGERVGSEGILDIGETGAMYAVAEVYEADVSEVAVGSEALVTSAAFPRPLRGVVERIAMRVRKQDVLGTDPAARTDARVVEVEIRLGDPDIALAANYTHLQVEVSITTARAGD